MPAAVIDLYVGSWAWARAELAQAVELGVNPGRLGFDPVDEKMRRDFLSEVQMPKYADWLIAAITAGDTSRWTTTYMLVASSVFCARDSTQK